MSPIFRIKSKKIIVRINCNDCSYQRAFKLKTRVSRFCTLQNKKIIKNKYFVDKPDRNHEINWFPQWCPLEDD